MQMPFAVPLFIEDRHFTSALVMVNGISLPSFADVVLRDLHGTEITRRRVQFAPHSQQRLEIRELLLTAGSRATAGSITIAQDPARESMLLAQLTMTYLGSRDPNYLDEEISMPSAEGSEILRGVAGSSLSSPLVSITSLAQSVQNLLVECLGASGARFTKSVQLLAGETLVTEACTDRTIHGGDLETALSDEESEGHQPHVTGIALTSDAMPGSFAAFGLTRHGKNDDRYFSGFTFEDPKMSMSATTVFTGVPVDSAKLLPEGRFVPHISFANFSAKPAHVVVKYSQMVASTPSVRDVAQLTIPARTTKELALDILEGDVDLRNSFLVSSETSPGDVAVKLVAKSDSRLREVELEAKDEMDPQNGGNHPWNLDQGTESTLLLFNHSGASQLFNVAISAGGMVWSKAYTIASMQTEAISIRALILNKIKDDDGNLLPQNALSGEVNWFTLDPGVGKGRMLQSNRHLAMARNFSCGQVIVLCGAFFNSGISTFGVGSTVGFGSLTTDFCQAASNSSCSGELATRGSAADYSWNSANANVAAISGSASSKSVNAFGSSAGSTRINGLIQTAHCARGGGGPVGVQTPVPTKVLPIATLSQGAIACSNGQGWSRIVTNQLQDQFGVAYRHGGIQMADILSFGSTNQLGLSPGPGSAPTDANGSWSDLYSDCTSACPSSGVSNALQTWTYNTLPLAHSNSVVYKCTSITIDGF